MKRNFIGIRQLITISATQQFRRFPRSAIPFVIDRKELKIAQIYISRPDSYMRKVVTSKFHPFELRLCSKIELRIPNNHMFLDHLELSGFGDKMTS